MSREKQIKEMTESICDIQCKGMKCDTCDRYSCEYRMLAEALYNAGYRKIPTTDWLTKGVPQEQIEREKECAFKEVAEKLGYRKQSDGEWKKFQELYPRYVCTACNHLFNNKSYKYCPDCGAKMKGGEK